MVAAVPSAPPELCLDGAADASIGGATERPRSRVALALAAFTGATAVGLSLLSWPFVAPAFRKVCLPYVPATGEQVTNVLRALKGRSGPLVDLGSGDGRIVMAAAAVGFRSTGVELNPWLVLWSRLWARRERLAHLATFQRADLFSLNLGLYQNVVIFGVKQMMPRLELQLSQQLPLTGCVVACRFPLPTWRPSHVYGEGADAVWVYFRPTADDEPAVAPAAPPGSAAADRAPRRYMSSCSAAGRTVGPAAPVPPGSGANAVVTVAGSPGDVTGDRSLRSAAGRRPA